LREFVCNFLILLTAYVLTRSIVYEQYKIDLTDFNSGPKYERDELVLALIPYYLQPSMPLTSIPFTALIESDTKYVLEQAQDCYFKHHIISDTFEAHFNGGTAKDNFQTFCNNPRYSLQLEKQNSPFTRVVSLLKIKETQANGSVVALAHNYPIVEIASSTMANECK